MESPVQPELIALLFPEPTTAMDTGGTTVTALMRDAEGAMQLHPVSPDPILLRMARVAGRLNCGKPILDPRTREVIGCEIEPLDNALG